MAGFPEGAKPLLVKALGANMRSAPPRELPADVRRLQNFHQKMLLAHADELSGMLEDGTTRALVVQWLDGGGHSLPKTQEKVLRLAAERPDGWEELLESAGAAARPSRASPAQDPAERLRNDLRRESEKTAAAREETKRVKEASRKSLDAERAAVKALRKELQSARAEAAAATGAATDAAAETERLRTEVQKLERRARKDLAAAAEGERTAKAQARALKKELSEARRRIASLERAVARKASPPKTPAGPDRPAGPRRALGAPPGRLADDPATLGSWLDAPSVHLLVDGYNVTKSKEGFPDLDLESQRVRLVEHLEKLTLKKKIPATIVFDGSEVGPGTSRPGKRRVRVEYSRPGETADDHLVAALESLPPLPVVLVTDDRELRERAAALGATLAGAAQLLGLTR